MLASFWGSCPARVCVLPTPMLQSGTSTSWVEYPLILAHYSAEAMHGIHWLEKNIYIYNIYVI